MVPLRIAVSKGRSFDSAGVDDARRRPLIVANPPSDQEFRRMIDRFLLTSSSEPGDLEATLRTRYPEATVRRRELTGESVEVWYVYRDGHWIGSEGNV
jgi:hypothetical protein